MQASARASSLCQSCAGFGKLGKFRAVAGRSCLLPRGNRAILLDLLQSAENRLVREVVEFLAAQIIVAAFHVTDRKPGAGNAFSKERMLQKWNVLVEKLFLQIFCAGGDDHALARADHRHQVRQSLSRACAGFNDQVPLFFQRLLDCLRHLQLSAAEFIRGMRAREHSAGSEELVERSLSSTERGPAGTMRMMRVGSLKPRESL